jgi:hypothetical protein
MGAPRGWTGCYSSAATGTTGDVGAAERCSDAENSDILVTRANFAEHWRRAALTLAGATALGGTIWMLGRRKAA